MVNLGLVQYEFNFCHLSVTLGLEVTNTPREEKVLGPKSELTRFFFKLEIFTFKKNCLLFICLLIFCQPNCHIVELFFFTVRN